ncbi:hypothetical protein SLEP1_g19262 [Rubroshorea leprosula]|nr:hypothetical protein SLEP1_g19262 [Rubroshorea leprosula]
MILSGLLQAIHGAEKGEKAALLLSPSCSIPTAAGISSRHSIGSLFTIFLTAPLHAFLFVLDIPGSDIEMETYNQAESLLSSSLNDWGLTLATSETLDPVWAQILTDPFLRRLLLRFMFCRAVLTLFAKTFDKKEFHPQCLPSLPESVSPMTNVSQTVVLHLASIFGATNRFLFSEGIALTESRETDTELISSS